MFVAIQYSFDSDKWDNDLETAIARAIRFSDLTWRSWHRGQQHGWGCEVFAVLAEIRAIIRTCFPRSGITVSKA